ncbi:MAG: hypothetical protein L6V93_03845 [Clostridiales bacterium]|nr:MAG: hypothetical protein L6V93_03845 [Clostridiales bacterium]
MRRASARFITNISARAVRRLFTAIRQPTIIRKTDENTEGENTENTPQGDGTKLPPPDANAPNGGQTANPHSQDTGGSNGQNPPSQPSTPPNNQPTVNLD